MAVTVVTPTSLVKDTPSGDLPVAGGTAINAANTMSIAYPREGKLLIQVNNTYAGAKVLTVAAGDFETGNIADLTQSFAQDDVRYLVLSSDRFKDFDGNVILSFETGMTGFVQAFYLP